MNDFMKQPGNGSAEVVLKRFDEQYKKYKFLEANLVAKRNRYECTSFVNWCVCTYPGMVTAVPAVLTPANSDLIPHCSICHEKRVVTSVDYDLVNSSVTISCFGPIASTFGDI